MPRTVVGNHAAASNTQQSGVPQGTQGGRARATGSRPGIPSLNMGDEFYLWALVLIEVFVMGYLRQHFRRHHGG